MTATNLHNVDVSSGEVLTPEALQLSQRQAVGLLGPYTVAREAAQQTKRDQDSLAVQLKSYLEAHPGEELQDGELGIVARLQRRHLTDRFDCMSMPDDLVLKLKAMGALSIDSAVIKALSDKSIDAVAAMRFKIPGGETMALIVTEEQPHA